MPTGPSRIILERIEGLYAGRSAAGLGEPQLLERFATRRDPVAFEALVLRHGPMVLGVCRRVLRDPDEAADAFQATFLVLARKAGAIRDGDRLGPWLHAVATKTAHRARSQSRKRAGMTALHEVGEPPRPPARMPPSSPRPPNVHGCWTPRSPASRSNTATR